MGDRNADPVDGDGVESAINRGVFPFPGPDHRLVWVDPVVRR